MQKVLYNVQEVSAMLAKGKTLILSGDERVLQQLPAGNWIGGTIPYFVGECGGEFTQDKIFVLELPECVLKAEAKLYSKDTIVDIYKDGPANGFTFVLIPATSQTHLAFALKAPTFESFAMSPVLGWITGVNLSELGQTAPKIFNGFQNGEAFLDGALALRIELSKDRIAEIGIINIFEQGNGDVIEFPEDGFIVKDALINGQLKNFSEYIKEIQADVKLPLVADYCGVMVNVSFQSINENDVALYAPVFKQVQYKLAKPIDDYVNLFTSQLEELGSDSIFFSCNCILNYLYSNLEGKQTGCLVGPATFGEIAYQLLNQTLVYLQLVKI